MASAMAMSCSTWSDTWKTPPPPAGIDQLHEFVGPADAADEIDALACARIIDAEERREQAVLQARHIELRNGVRIRRRFQAKSYHAPSRYIRISPGLCGFGSHSGQREGAPHGLEKCFLGLSI